MTETITTNVSVRDNIQKEISKQLKVWGLSKRVIVKSSLTGIDVRTPHSKYASYFQMSIQWHYKTRDFDGSPPVEVSCRGCTDDDLYGGIVRIINFDKPFVDNNTVIECLKRSCQIIFCLKLD